MTSDNLDKDAFTKCVAMLFVQRWPTASVQISAPLVVEFGEPDGWTGHLFLERVWNEYQGGVPSKKAMKNALRAWSNVVDRPEAKQLYGHIVPLIRSRHYIDQLNNDGVTTTTLPLAADLVVLFGVDSSHSITTLGAEERALFTPDDIELLQIALLNFHHLACEQIAIESHPGGYGSLALGNDYESSLLLHDDVWQDITSDLGTAPIACIPARDALLFAPQNDPRAVQAMHETAMTLFTDATVPVSTALILRHPDGDWRRHDEHTAPPR